MFLPASGDVPAQAGVVPVVACACWSRLPVRGGCFRLSGVRQRVLRLPARACARTACIRPAGSCCAESGSEFCVYRHGPVPGQRVLGLPEPVVRCQAACYCVCRNAPGGAMRFISAGAGASDGLSGLSALRAGGLYLRMAGSTVGVHYPFGDIVLRPVSAKKHLSVLRGFRVYREVLYA